MSLKLAYWVVFLICIVFGIWQHGADWKVYTPNAIALVLFLLLGWQVFGPPIQRGKSE